jgi:hypothetical protein
VSHVSDACQSAAFVPWAAPAGSSTGCLASLWLLTLLAAENVVRARAVAWIGLAWLALEYLRPVDWPIDPRLASATNLVPMATMVALVVLAVLSDTRSAAGRATGGYLAPTAATG